jgi:hypothetical protein
MDKIIKATWLITTACLSIIAMTMIYSQNIHIGVKFLVMGPALVLALVIVYLQAKIFTLSLKQSMKNHTYL